MGPQSDGSSREMSTASDGDMFLSRGAGSRATGNGFPLATGLVGHSKGSYTGKLEHMERYYTAAGGGTRVGGLTGLGIRVTNHQSKSFLSLGDDDEAESREEISYRGTSSSLRFGLITTSDNREDRSDAVSIASTCPDLDLTPIVDAFPSPPTPASMPSPPVHSASHPQLVPFDVHRQLRHRPSISTIASELTLASTASTSSSLETPSPQTPSVSEMTPIAIPRPNAAAIRRVRSFAKPVSVYFSPDRPPALPLPVLPTIGTTPPTPTSPSLPVPSLPAPSLSRSEASPTSQPLIQTPYGFFSPPYGRIPRNPEPPSAPPPDRPLPSLPSLPEQAPRDSRLVAFPSSGVPGSQKKLPLPPPSQLSRRQSCTPIPEAPAVPSKDDLDARSSRIERPRTVSVESDSSTPTIKSPSTSSINPPSPLDDSLSTLPSVVAVPCRQPRTRVESESSVASLDISHISKQLDQLVCDNISPDPSTSSSDKLQGTEEKEKGEVAELTEKEQERERVRRLISRVSSVIEMRKLSTASSSTTSSIVEASPNNRERNGYKAYKLTRKPSLSPSTSFSSFSTPGHSTFKENFQGGGGGTPTTSEDRSRTSSYNDSDSESSASEEMFDLSFDSQLLSPSSIGNTSTSSSSSSTSSGEYHSNRFSSPLGGSGSRRYVRRSHVPPRWAGRRRSSETTIEEEEVLDDDRLKRSATRRADQFFSQRDTEHYDVVLPEEAAEEIHESPSTEVPSRRKTLRNVASNETFQSRLRSPGTKTLRTVSSVPTLRNPSLPDSPLSRPSTYSSSPLSSEFGSPKTTGLRPLITSSPPHTRRSFISTPSASPSSSRIPLSGFSRNSPSPQFSDPFSSCPSPSLNYRAPSATPRKSSLPIPSSFGQTAPASTGLRRPSAPAALAGPHRRKSSLANLSYHHTTSIPPPSSPSPLSRSLHDPRNSRMVQPSSRIASTSPR